MTTTTRAPADAQTSRLHPRYDGANIRTWIGFKQFLALAEEAVLDWFRARGIGPYRLFHEHGLELAVVDSSALLPAVLEVDDEVTATARATGAGAFAVTLTVGSRVVLRGRVRVALIGEPAGAPGELTDLVAAGAGSVPAFEEAPLRSPTTWTWRARYFHCHYSDRVQHSAYVRALEEVVDRFLADRGLSVGTLLAERGWIPVVSRVRVQLLADAHMEEDVHTRFGVVEVLKRVTWDGQMRCHVVRDGATLPVAAATILHGYAVGRGPGAGGLAELDDATVAALSGNGAPR